MKTKIIINYLVITILVIILLMLIFRVYKMFSGNSDQNKTEQYFVSSDGVNRKNPYKEIQDLAEKITGTKRPMCFPNYMTTQDSREYEAKFYKNLNHLITDAVMNCIQKQDYVNLARIYLLLPEIFKMESKSSYEFIAYGPDKKVIPRERYSTDVIANVEIIGPDGKKMTNDDIITFMGQINRGALKLDPYYVTDSITRSGKTEKLAMNPTRPPTTNTPKTRSCKNGDYCCKSGLCFQPTMEYTLFYKMVSDVIKELPKELPKGKNTLFNISLFGRIAPYLYVKRNSPVGVIKTIRSQQNDRLPSSPYICCEDQPNCKMADR